MNDLFEFEKFTTVDVVDTYLIEQVSKLMEKANEQKASQARKPTLSIKETRKRIGEKMVDSKGEEASFGV